SVSTAFPQIDDASAPVSILTGTPNAFSAGKSAFSARPISARSLLSILNKLRLKGFLDKIKRTPDVVIYYDYDNVIWTRDRSSMRDSLIFPLDTHRFLVGRLYSLKENL